MVEQTTAGTDLFHSTLAFDYGNEESNALMRKVWAPTPFMVDAFTGRCGADRDREMREWCRDQFGGECLPLHERDGRWQRGNATINGWTWFGFADREAMDAFVARFGSFNLPEEHGATNGS